MEFDGLFFVSTCACDGCAMILRQRGELSASVFGKVLRVKLHQPAGRWRVRGDHTLLLRGAVS
jgi:hypothetical protein